MCGPCAQMDWTEAAADASDETAADILYTPFVVELPAQHLPDSQHSPELEHLLESDQPTVVECFNAEEQAKQAINELAAQGQASAEAQETSSPAKPASSVAENQRTIST